MKVDKNIIKQLKMMSSEELRDLFLKKDINLISYCENFYKNLNIGEKDWQITYNRIAWKDNIVNDGREENKHILFLKDKKLYEFFLKDEIIQKLYNYEFNKTKDALYCSFIQTDFELPYSGGNRMNRISTPICLYKNLTWM